MHAVVAGRETRTAAAAGGRSAAISAGVVVEATTASAARPRNASSSTTRADRVDVCSTTSPCKHVVRMHAVRETCCLDAPCRPVKRSSTRGQASAGRCTRSRPVRWSRWRRSQEPACAHPDRHFAISRSQANPIADARCCQTIRALSDWRTVRVVSPIATLPALGAAAQLPVPQCGAGRPVARL